MSRPTRRSYDAVAARYARDFAGELRGKPLDRALLGLLAELAGTAPVLDVGAGPGHVAGHLRDAGCRVLATDLSPAMCRHAPVPAFAGDMTALAVGRAVLGAVVCFYAVIHLDRAQRARAYREFARVLRPGGVALVAFHVSDADITAGHARSFTRFLDADVDLTFRFLDPAGEEQALEAAGFEVTARLERAPYPGGEHPSRRAYLLATRS